MDTYAPNKSTFDRSEEDLGNVVEFGHVNLGVPDQQLATLFYVAALGLTRDPYMMSGVDLMWINVGQSQFHLPTQPANVLAGTIGLVVPDLHALFARCADLQRSLTATQFAFRQAGDAAEVTCPWGNRFRVHAPDPERFGPINLGMAYLEFDVPEAISLSGIAAFYREMLSALAGVETDSRGEYAWVSVGTAGRFIFRRTPRSIPYDGHHLQITLANFAAPHDALLRRGLITQESDQHQYRFNDIVDPATGEVLFTIEHEVRSMRHPLYGRPLVNRNADQTNRNYVPGRESWQWALAADVSR